MKQFWIPQNSFQIYCSRFSGKIWKESVAGHKLFQERKHISSIVYSLLVLRTISRFWKNGPNLRSRVGTSVFQIITLDDDGREGGFNFLEIFLR